MSKHVSSIWKPLLMYAADVRARALTPRFPRPNLAATPQNQYSHQNTIAKHKSITSSPISYWKQPKAPHESISSIRNQTKSAAGTQQSHRHNSYRLIVNKRRRIEFDSHELLPSSDSHLTYNHVDRLIQTKLLTAEHYIDCDDFNVVAACHTSICSYISVSL